MHIQYLRSIGFPKEEDLVQILTKALFPKNNKNSNDFDDSDISELKIKDDSLVKEYYFKYFKEFRVTIAELLKSIKRPDYLYITLLTLFEIFIETELHSINYKPYCWKPLFQKSFILYKGLFPKYIPIPKNIFEYLKSKDSLEFKNKVLRNIKYQITANFRDPIKFGLPCFIFLY